MLDISLVNLLPSRSSLSVLLISSLGMFAPNINEIPLYCCFSLPFDDGKKFLLIRTTPSCVSVIIMCFFCHPIRNVLALPMCTGAECDALKRLHLVAYMQQEGGSKCFVMFENSVVQFMKQCKLTLQAL